MKHAHRVTSALAIAAVALNSCVSGGTTTKAGGDAEPVTLRIGTDDNPGAPAADQIEEFAQQVEELSGGQLRIEAVWRAAGEDLNDWDQQVARLVVSGELDLGNIPARAWDTEGVETFRALHAPFLVTTDELLDRVVADEVADEMLAGLDEIGLTGLAVVPEGLRRMFSFGEPLLGPEDFAGLTVRAPTSETTHALFRSLGAEVDDFGGEDVGAAIDAGTLAAAESSFAFAATLPRATAAVGNAVLFPKANVIVANSEAFDELTAEQQEVLRAAALATRDEAIAVSGGEADLAASYCGNGGTIVLADDGDVEALREAARPVYEELEQDESTAAMIARIRELGAEILTDGIEPPAIEPCGATVVETGPAPEPTPAAEAAGIVLDGVYRWTVTAQQLIDGGVDPIVANWNGGTHTFTMGGGEFVDLLDGEGPCAGTYEISGSRVTFQSVPLDCINYSATASVEGDQVVWSDLVVLPPNDDPVEQLLMEVQFGATWTRVGDADSADASPATTSAADPGGLNGTYPRR